jgi:phage gpG-like protein
MAVRMNIIVQSGDTERELRNLSEGLQDYTTPLRRSATYMEGAIGRRFKSAPWTPLSPATIKRHPRRAGGKPLNDTGRLRMSVTGGAVKTVSKQRLVYGTTLVYAPLHNFGGNTKFGYVPQREFLYFDKANERAIKKIFSDYVEELTE